MKTFYVTKSVFCTAAIEAECEDDVLDIAREDEDVCWEDYETEYDTEDFQ